MATLEGSLDGDGGARKVEVNALGWGGLRGVNDWVCVENDGFLESLGGEEGKCRDLGRVEMVVRAAVEVERATGG